MLILALRALSILKGIWISTKGDKIHIRKIGKDIILRRANLPYSRDVISNYNFYFEATSGITKDFSATGRHEISGFNHFPIQTPGLPEPMQTLIQYSKFLDLRGGDTIIDLGAYSGLSAIFFSQIVGSAGTVIAVEADPVNGECCETNFKMANKKFGHSPKLVKKAIWHEETVLEFAAEGNLGSAVRALLPRANTPGIQVETTTLSKLVSSFELKKVDGIKADIEGSEYWAFKDSDFFKQFHPVIVFEPAEEELDQTKSRRVIELLESYGYECSRHSQEGSVLPLIVCK